MAARARWVLVAATLGVAAAYGVWAWRVSTPEPAAAAAPADELRWLPVENAEIFDTMGARVWRVHVPADQLRGRTRFVLTMTRDGEKPQDVLEAPLRQSRREADPLDLTFVMYWDDPVHSEVRRLHLTLASAEFSYTGSRGNPLPGFTGFGRPNELGDLTKGVELCRLSKRDDAPGEGEKVVFTLRLE